MSQSVPLNRIYLDARGNRVTVIRWDRAAQQVFFMRKGYPYECMQPLERFKEKFKRVEV